MLVHSLDGQQLVVNGASSRCLKFADLPQKRLTLEVEFVPQARVGLLHLPIGGVPLAKGGLYVLIP
jgi:hypothetical protein